MELFEHILHLDFEWLINTYQTSIYLILFLVIFIETGLVAMPFLPGDSLLFTAGLFARLGYLDLATLLLLLFFAAVLGDNTNYFIGKTLGLKVMKIKIKGKNIVKQEYLDKTHQFYEKYGVKTIIMARFIPIVRTFAPFVAGIAEMKYRRFLSFDILGGALWIGSLTLAGYFLGEIPWIRENIELVAIGIILISVMPILITILKNKFAKNKNNSKIEKKNNQQIIIGIFASILIVLGSTLPFHFVFKQNDFMIFPKNSLTFSYTIITQQDIDNIIERYNNSSFLNRQAMNNEPVIRKLMEKGLIIEETHQIQN